MARAVYRCSFCGADRIETATCDHGVVVTCLACPARYRVEFNPPDNPRLTARIVDLREPEIPRRA